MANDITSLNIFRIIQGAGGGLLTPVGMAMLFRTFSPEERPKISRFIILPIAVAPAIGPIIGGFFVDQMSWRWAFYINLPFGIVALLFGLLFLAEHVEKSAGRFDSLGFILSAPGFAMLIYALSQGPSKGVDFSRNYEYWDSWGCIHYSVYNRRTESKATDVRFTFIKRTSV